eukprot:TRINITY_DN8946_c0_g1_i1.p1 TRINITY_DN8946_c0_g1~~TRINITY_DN8946_c0_g1_i1.p1  ORF type:complete len:486 (-),score=110.98 TRINITY_DN8946_c0_g1_i1:32-1489(-)
MNKRKAAVKAEEKIGNVNKKAKDGTSFATRSVEGKELPAYPSLKNVNLQYFSFQQANHLISVLDQEDRDLTRGLNLLISVSEMNLVPPREVYETLEKMLTSAETDERAQMVFETLLQLRRLKSPALCFGPSHIVWKPSAANLVKTLQELVLGVDFTVKHNHQLWLAYLLSLFDDDIEQFELNLKNYNIASTSTISDEEMAALQPEEDPMSSSLLHSIVVELSTNKILGKIFDVIDKNHSEANSLEIESIILAQKLLSQLGRLYQNNKAHEKEFNTVVEEASAFFVSLLPTFGHKVAFFKTMHNHPLRMRIIDRILVKNYEQYKKEHRRDVTYEELLHYYLTLKPMPTNPGEFDDTMLLLLLCFLIQSFLIVENWTSDDTSYSSQNSASQPNASISSSPVSSSPPKPVSMSQPTPRTKQSRGPEDLLTAIQNMKKTYGRRRTGEGASRRKKSTAAEELTSDRVVTTQLLDCLEMSLTSFVAAQKRR